MARVALLLAWTILLLPAHAGAYDGIVDKKVFSMPSYTTADGEVIANVRIGYETYGTLNTSKDNAILILPYFSGTSHAAGKYAASDPAPGYWDSIIGSGKPIDTDKYFVISADGLVNQNTKNPHTVTTGPASIDPATGQPYGMRFPIVTVLDFVNVQKALVESLGITRLRAVMGLSMGGLQSFEWASAFPDSTDRIIPVVGAAEASGYLIGWLNVWSAPIKLDPKWNGGDYYGKEEPVEGLATAFRTLLLQAEHYRGVAKAFGRRWAEDGKDPATSWTHRFAVEEHLDAFGTQRARDCDANSFLYQAKAIQLFVTGHKGALEDGLQDIRARVLLLPAQSDLMVFPDYAKEAAEILRSQGKRVEYFEIPGDGGHIDGVFNIVAAGALIRKFLDE
jgi:homoserine O-acetyltransferase